VKLAAQELGLAVLQPKSINSADCVERLRSLNLDLLVTAAFGQLLRSVVLQLPRLGCVNVHASLLPKYRGAAPIPWALIHGERETGVTTFLMDEGMDTGPILLQRRTEIGPEETAGELGARLAQLGAELAVETVEKLLRGGIQPQPQPPNGPLAPKLHREDGRIRWEWEAWRIHNLVRGLSPKPGAFAFWSEEMVKILRTRIAAEGGKAGAPGQILPQRDKLLAAAGTGILEILELQPAGCRVITGRDFLNGYCRRDYGAFR
jgi:methionyl-tRNA formyltransferase